MVEHEIDEDRVKGWIDRYLAAWRSNDRADIEDLFTADARYRPQPDAEPAVGRSTIADGWLESADRPGTWTCELAPTLLHEDTAIITGWTNYSDGERYLNLWVVRFEEGRCAEFTEWWMPRRAST